MAKLFKFEVITPIRSFYSDEVEMIVFETDNGQMGVMADHIPMLVANKDCTLKIEKNNEIKYAFITEGFIEIANGKVTAIVDEAQWCDEIDLEISLNKLKTNSEELANPKADLSMKAELNAVIRRSQARIKTVGMMNDRR